MKSHSAKVGKSLKSHDPDVVTQELNALYATVNSSLNKELAKMQFSAFAKSCKNDKW